MAQKPIQGIRDPFLDNPRGLQAYSDWSLPYPGVSEAQFGPIWEGQRSIRPFWTYPEAIQGDVRPIWAYSGVGGLL